jgi:hypothetical protein
MQKIIASPVPVHSFYLFCDSVREAGASDVASSYWIRAQLWAAMATGTHTGRAHRLGRSAAK